MTEDIMNLPVQTCPYQDWFKFRKCTIKSCKNFTTKTKCGCLGIDRVVPVGNKLISDAELNLYKFIKPVSTRLVSMKRKKAIDRVKTVLVLNAYLEYIRTQRKAGDIAYNTRLIEALELAFPLKLNRLHFHNWMWPHLTDPKLWKKFVQSNTGECQDYSVYQLLFMSKEKYTALVEQIKHATKN